MLGMFVISMIIFSANVLEWIFVPKKIVYTLYITYKDQKLLSNLINGYYYNRKCVKLTIIFITSTFPFVFILVSGIRPKEEVNGFIYFISVIPAFAITVLETIALKGSVGRSMELQ